MQTSLLSMTRIAKSAYYKRPIRGFFFAYRYWWSQDVCSVVASLGFIPLSSLHNTNTGDISQQIV